jgi:DNA processing protein
MNKFLLDDSRFERKIASLSAVDSRFEDYFARAALSMITEPGDRFAGFLVQSIGASELLEFEIKNKPTDDLRVMLRDVNALEEIENAFSDLRAAHREARERWRARLSLAALEKAIDSAIQLGAQLLTPSDVSWPSKLDDLEQSKPHCLWVRSQVPLEQLNCDSLAVVGSRNSTNYGEWVTSEIVADSAGRGLAIVSGGAYGIDAVAHRSALAVEAFSVAFMAGGIDKLYPSGNYALLEKLAISGAVVAEQAPGASPTKWRFLQRNRLIAGLSNATVVIEAGARSGALNTVTHAHALSREVGAVPGAITSQASAGCNRLIADGQATILVTAADAAKLALGEPGWFQPELGGLGALETRALDAMKRQPLASTQIAATAGLTTREVSIALGQLALLGFVEQVDKGWVKLPL